jgi:hypothetical protein
MDSDAELNELEASILATDWGAVYKTPECMAVARQQIPALTTINTVHRNLAVLLERDGLTPRQILQIMFFDLVLGHLSLLEAEREEADG